ncbi:zinc ribbon domain-containing protein [Candidatus Enterococcus ikei]|uniref:Zinc-ribbon domain-containing protein n=1 Tax=Candidatus Enterococcus ikei TaxID=2815326 RepID=A0ABS3GWL0_9ENTE|nr:zinc ribbon domain-containing protein [Enterococcus sp. DIV0869a]MBO0439654.1 zinc-ribbon domain-containing protein [Enterococcus sp. DIV0869a]
MKICHSCQYENQEEALFCENCGEKLTTSGNDQTKVEVKSEAKEHETVKHATCSCGASLEDDDQFCPACGKSVSQETLQPSKKELPIVTKPPMNKKQKILIVISAVVMCLIGGSYFVAKSYYSYENQSKRMIEIVKNKDIDQMKKLTVSTDPNYNVTKDELKTYFAYYQQNKHRAAFSRLITNLESQNNQTSELALKKKGKKFFLFDDYHFELKPKYITVTANQKDMKLFLNNQEKETTDKTQFQTVWGPLTPAEYTVKGELAGEKSETTIDLVQSQGSDYEQMNQVNLDFRKVSFKVTSNISDADVFIDDKKIGQLSTGELEVKDQIWHQGITLQLKKTLANKSVIETKQFEINDANFESSKYDPDYFSSTINLDFSGIKSESDVENFLASFYSNVTSYTSTYMTYDETTKQKFSTFFTDGKGNSEYQDFDTFIQAVRDSKVKNSVNGTATVESVKMNGKNTYDVQYLIKYKTVYKDYKQQDVTQIFRYKKATLIYDEGEDRFKIQSLGGKENFEVVDNGGIE